MVDVAELADDDPRPRQVGLIVMSTDEVGDAAYRDAMPPEVRVFTTRAAPDLDAYERGEFVIAGGLPAVADTLPSADRLGAIAFGCTSGTVILGEPALRSSLGMTRPGVPVATPPTAAVEALASRGLRRIAVLSPYPALVHGLVVDHLRAEGLDVASEHTISCDSDAEVSRLPYADLLSAARTATAMENLDALFISCMALPVVDRLNALQADVGLPVFSSTQVLIWQTLRLLGLDPSLA